VSVIASSLPITETFAPESQQELADLVARGYASDTAMYPLGGGTGLGNGLTARRQGWSLATTNLNRVVDYPCRDMTITVEAGVTMQTLAGVLSENAQRLAIDAPQAGLATIGGVVATATSGPRRYGQGSIRDYVIGISAIDGRGVPFKAGGRVVKNVAGYDFCKLLTGSRGSLAVITQVTFKLRPMPEATALVACDVTNLDEAESLLAALVRSATTPAAIELVSGPAWADDPGLGPAATGARARLVVGLEGTEPEVAWTIEQLLGEWREASVAAPRTVTGAEALGLWSRLIEFPAANEAALVVKANLPPSAVCRFVRAAAAIDADCSISAHAGNGIVYARFPEFSAGDALRVLVAGLQPAAANSAGQAIVYACASGVELTHQAVWGPAGGDAGMMRAVKSKFDPKGLFNPGLAIYAC
jgi:glycolate oxidase FAD binding subunit